MSDSASPTTARPVGYQGGALEGAPSPPPRCASGPPPYGRSLKPGLDLLARDASADRERLPASATSSVKISRASL